MKIITKGKNPDKKPIRDTCSKCNTVFEYTSTDVQPDSRDGDYVVCPVCKSFIAVKS